LKKYNFTVKALIIALFSISISACESEKISNPVQSFQNDYFNFRLNDTCLFHHTDYEYSTFGVDSSDYYTKEIVQKIDTFSTYIEYQIGIFKAQNKEDSFVNDGFKQLKISTKEVIENKNNTLYLIAELPLELNKKYNENRYNSKDEKLIEINSIDQKVSIGPDLELENTLLIIKNKNKNIVEDIEQSAVYQKNKGLVYEIDKQLSTQPNEPIIGHKYLKIREL
jgi:hypothetical protein